MAAPQAPRALVDAHVHFTHRSQVRYSWLDASELHRGGADWAPADYAAQAAGLGVREVIFAEVAADEGCGAAEARFACALTTRELPVRVAGAVVYAPVHEGGAATTRYLDSLGAQPSLKGVRRLVQQEKDEAFAARPLFVEGVRSLASRGLCFDLGVVHINLPACIELARKCPDVAFVLDHIGKPPIRDAPGGGGDSGGGGDPFALPALRAWADNMRALAALPNVVCKVSGVVTETRGADWTLDGVRPFVAHALDSFGYDRCLFASDWFVCTRCTTLPRWVAALDALLDERRATDAQRAAFFSDNATRVYRLRAQ